MTNQKSIEFAAICKEMNRIVKEQGVSRKEAYKLAKEKLTGATAKKRRGRKPKTYTVVLCEYTKENVTKILQENKVVVITYKSPRGVETTTKMTLMEDCFRKQGFPIAGRKEAKNENEIVAYDTMHGLFRTVPVESIKEIKK